MKHTQEYLDAPVEIATVYDTDFNSHTVHVMLNSKSDDGYICKFHNGDERRLKVQVGIGRRFRFEDGDAIIVPMFEG